MSKTPAKSNKDFDCFSPSKELQSSNKDLPGIPKTVFTHVMQLQKLIKEWKTITHKGTKTCQTISNIKRPLLEDDSECDKFPKSLIPPTEYLINLLSSLHSLLTEMQQINRQLKAVAKLQNNKSPVILTWSAEEISQEVTRITHNFEKEYSLKETITENIAHVKDKSQLEVYVSAWKLNPYVDLESTAYLFVEVGLNPISLDD